MELQLLSTGGRKQVQVLKSISSALSDLLSVFAQGTLLHSRLQHIAQTDAPSHFFFGLESKHGQRGVVHSLRADTGQRPLLRVASGWWIFTGICMASNA